MTREEKLFNEICERCENFATGTACEDIATCPAYKLYCVAKSKRQVVYRQNVWQDQATPRPEMI